MVYTLRDKNNFKISGRKKGKDMKISQKSFLYALEFPSASFSQEPQAIAVHSAATSVERTHA